MMILYRILCILRRDHHYHKEIIIDENTTKNYCKCGRWLEFDWSYMGGYKKSVNKISNLKRKREWEDNDQTTKDWKC